MLIENQTVTLVADLSASGGVRILSTPDGAEVKIDGELIGRTPVQRDTVTSGDHIIQFKLPGYFDHKETIKVEGGREKVFSVDLKPLPSGPTPEQVAKRKMGMSSFGAKVNPVGGVTADFGAGYPYYLTVRLTVGAVAKPGIDVGVEFQTFFDMANLSMFGRMQLVEAGPFAFGARANVGGGTGVNGRDTYFFDLSAIGSLAFGGVATVNGTMRYSAWTDKFCPTATQIEQRRHGRRVLQRRTRAVCGCRCSTRVPADARALRRRSALLRPRRHGGDRPLHVLLLPARVPAVPRPVLVRAAHGLRGQVQQRAVRRQRSLPLRDGRPSLKF